MKHDQQDTVAEYLVRIRRDTLALGQRVHDGYLGHWLVEYPGRTHHCGNPFADPRLVTQAEMYAASEYEREQKWQRIDRDGCCGEIESVSVTGACIGIGICPRVAKAQHMLESKDNE